MSQDAPVWMTPAEVAALSRRSTQTVHRALKSGALVGTRPGGTGRWLIHREQVDAWLAPAAA